MTTRLKRLKKEDYITETTKQLEIEFKNRVEQDRNMAYAQRIVDKIPQDKKQLVLDILSRELSSK